MMPKATIVYALPEEYEEYKDAMNGGLYKYAISDFDSRLRALSKYEEKDVISIDEARKILRECLGDLDF